MIGKVGAADNALDPVFQRDFLWYFFDESWSEEIGPCESEKAARTALRDYAESL